MISAEIRIISIMSLPCMQLFNLRCQHNRKKNEKEGKDIALVCN